MKFKEFFISLFKDERGQISMKPVIAILGALALIVVLMIYCISKKSITISDSIINAVVIITLAGIGMDTADKFSFKKLFSPASTPLGDPDPNKIDIASTPSTGSGTYIAEEIKN